VIAAPIVVTGAAQAAGHHGRAAATDCATVTIKAIPKVNTNMTAETIISKVTSCATATETVVLKQNILGPTAVNASRPIKQWTITLAPSQAVTKVRHFPYACCGTYHVSDKVYATGGQKLANTGTGFTFA
jgi:hypothetical protein